MTVDSFHLGNCQIHVQPVEGAPIIIGAESVELRVEVEMLGHISSRDYERVSFPINQTVSLVCSCARNQVTITYPEKTEAPQKLKEEPKKRLIRRRSTAINCNLIDNPGEKI